MTKEETKKILRGWPVFTKQDIRESDDLFRHYLFFDAKGGVTASCCGKTQTLGRDQLGSHREKGTCPFCGKSATWYGKRFGKKNLLQYVPVMFLHKRGKTVYAQTFWMQREYTYTLTPRTKLKLTYSYRLRQGAADMWENFRYGGDCYIDDWFKRHYAPLCDETGNVSYHVIGLERLKGTHLQYVGAGDCQNSSGKCYDLTKRLMLACYYPIEMLEKLGLSCFVKDLMNGVTNQEIIDYSQTDPRKALGLNGTELKQLAPYTYKTILLRMRKRLQKRGYKVGIDDCADLLLLCKNDYCKLIRLTERTGVSPLKLRRYLAGQVNQCGHAYMGGFDTRRSAYRYYVDYLQFCEDLNENIRDRLVAFPRDLATAHDRMAARAAEMAREIEEQKNAVLVANNRKKMASRIQKYSFEYGKFKIVFPLTMKEIETEGSELRHCVGGYASRHINGATTILFLRRVSAPNKPLVTIEMNGNRLVQVHGYRNELEKCKENPKRIPARELYREVIDAWLDWIGRGSPRNKDGSVKLPKQREVKTA